MANPPRSLDSDVQLAAFRDSLEKALVTSGNAILDRWLKRTDEELRRAIADMMKTTLEILNNPATPGINPSNATGGDWGTRLAHIFASGLMELFSDTKTRVSTRESERSRQAQQDFRESRSQSAAQATSQAARGQRNL